MIKRDSLDDVDLGYGFLPDYFGQGFGYESAQAVMEYGRRELKMKKLVAITTADNQRCIKLLNKLGLHFVENIEEPEAAPALGLYAVEL
ncbi:GNAT family N-acetyltransferase [Photobacterium kasasachensis]|uniref:GNAT family N-acetyltransferase n=1 Tax=Photobacterium kasasachensis TaxID=2910240 RepID=UPI003D124F8B